MYYTQLRAFHAVALHGGFTRAANELCLTQPAISDQVRKLERLFDVTLFERGRGRVTLSDTGKELFEITKRLFEVEREAVELLGESRDLHTGHIKLAADAPLHGVRLIGLFKKQFPGISIILRTGNTDWVRNQLHENAADLGILALASKAMGKVSAEFSDSYERIILQTDPLVAFVATDHEFGSRRTISLKQLVKEPLVMREEGSVTRAIIEGELRRLDLDYSIAMEADGRGAVREAVAAGIGVGIVSEPEFGCDTRLHAIRLTDCKTRMTECLICPKERLRLRSVRAFWQIAQDFQAK